MRGSERKSRLFWGVHLMGCMSLTALTLAAQQSGTVQGGAPASGAVPNLIRYSGVLKDTSGAVITTLSGVTFLIYKDEQGGTALWMETQNVQPDKTGHYTVQLGAVSKDGLPVDVFMTGEARWLAVQIGNEAEQPRVTLVAVPYAMKAADAQTLGGLPASAFVLAAPSVGNAAASSAPSDSSTSTTAPPPSSSAVTTNGGTVNALPMFTTATNIQNSILTQTGGAINVAGKLTLPATGKATSTTAFNSQPQNFVASAFNGAAALPQTFQWQAEPVNNGQKTATGTLNLLFGSAGNKPAETGLNIASNGQISFAKGQTFPGTATVTSVGSGAGLTGGPITSTGTLSIANGGVSNTMLQNSSLTVNPGTALVGGGAVSLGGSTTLNLDTSKVPLLAANNNFTGNQTVTGNLSATGVVVAGSGYQIGIHLFAFGSVATDNVFLGFAGNTSTTGQNNTASGAFALSANTIGSSNTASGIDVLIRNTTGGGNTANGGFALDANTAGNVNTASGFDSLAFNTTGSNNTASGYLSGVTADASSITGSNDTFMGSGTALSTGTLSNATAIGANAEVDAPNAMVLGSIAGVNNATASTLVGIGTTAPAYPLHLGNADPNIKNFLRVEGPSTANTGGMAASFGGYGAFEIDSVGVQGGRFNVREDGEVIMGNHAPTGWTLTLSPLSSATNSGRAIAFGWDVFSSRRWKTNIHPLADALGKVERLRGVSYDLKASGKHEIGVIAEEVGEIVPEVVSYEANKKDAQGVDYSRLTALLIEAVKQQQKQIAALRSQLHKQTLKHARLESRLAQFEADRDGHFRQASAATHR